MTGEQYGARVLAARLEALARQEGEILARADGHEASITRLTADLEQRDLPARYRDEAEREIAKLRATATEMRREAGELRRIADLLAEAKTLVASPAKPIPTLEDVIFTLDTKANVSWYTSSFQRAIDKLRSASVGDWGDALIILESIAWPSEGNADAYAQAAIRELRRLIAEARGEKKTPAAG